MNLQLLAFLIGIFTKELFSTQLQCYVECKVKYKNYSFIGIFCEKKEKKKHIFNLLLCCFGTNFNEHALGSHRSTVNKHNWILRFNIGKKFITICVVLTTHYQH